MDMPKPTDFDEGGDQAAAEPLLTIANPPVIQAFANGSLELIQYLRESLVGESEARGARREYVQKDLVIGAENRHPAAENRQLHGVANAAHGPGVLGGQASQGVKRPEEEQAIRRPRQAVGDPICGNDREVEDRLPLDCDLGTAQRWHRRRRDRNGRGAERTQPTPAGEIPDRRDGDRAGRISAAVANRRYQRAEQSIPAGSRSDSEQTLLPLGTPSNRRQGEGVGNILVSELLQRRDRSRLRFGDPLQPARLDRGAAPLPGSPAPAPKAPSHFQPPGRPSAAQLPERAAPSLQLRKIH